MIKSPAQTRDDRATCGFCADESHGTNVVLVGGPREFPDAARYRQIGSADQKVKVAYRSGYEHFERTSEHFSLEDDCQGLIFRWTTRTRIAE